MIVRGQGVGPTESGGDHVRTGGGVYGEWG